MPPLSVFVLVELSVQELAIPEFAPAVKQSCVSCVSVCALIPWLSIVFAMVFPAGAKPKRKANAVCTLAVNTTAIVEIATIAINVLWLFIPFNL